MPGSGYATIVFTRMNVLEIGADRPVAGSNIFLLDIGMEGVKENAYVRMANLLGERRSIGSRVQKIGFKSVQRFDGENNAVGGKRIADGLKALNRPLPFIARPATAWQVPHRGVKRSGDNPDSRLCRDLGYVFEVHASAAPYIGTGA